jgi:glycosyltransferase involved in cell wall biosynthesis
LYGNARRIGRYGMITPQIEFAPPTANDFALGPPPTEPLSATSPPTQRSADQAQATVRVLHLINGEHYSGAERVQDLLARELPHFGYDVGFACVKPFRFPNARESKSVPLVELPMRGRFDLRVVKKLTQLIQSEQYALVHAHTPRTALVGRLASQRADVPLIYHVHSPAGHDSTRHFVNAFNSLVEWHTLRSADRLIAVSPSLQRYMAARGFDANRIVCVPNGVPIARATIDRSPPVGTWTLGTIALFRPRKGTEVLLEALAALRSWGVDVRLRAVGGFETLAYETAILGLADRLGLAGSIDWTGFTRDVNAELAQMDVFALPSLFGEGLPMVVLEAMAAGVPVVATRVEGVPEAVVHRETGLLVDPDSVSQLASAVRQFVDGKVNYVDMSRRGRERHAELFSDVAMARNVAHVYNDVLKQKGAARNSLTQPLPA